MERDQFVDFICEFTDKLAAGEYSAAVQFGEDMLTRNELSPSQADWLNEAISIIRAKHLS